VTRDSRYVIFFYRTIHRNCESMKIYNCFEFNDGLCITDNHAGISSVGKSMCVACQPLHTIRVDRRTLGGTGWRTKKSYGKYIIPLWIPNRRVRVHHFRGKKSKRGVPVATAVVTVLIINLSMRVPIYGPFEIINVTFWTGEDSVDIIILDCTVRDARNDL
jgi:hypothetical protein